MSATNTEQAHTNRLAGEKSPYLLQHATNPVDWYPWGEEAFARARSEDRPVFLSVGYATCHWCHVMERESFEDEEVARLLNETFVCIKVDREERPDIDQVYMTVCQMITGRGGWPLTIMMTPDRRPFFAGTYLPKHSRFGRAGMVDLVPQVRELWATRRQDLERSAQEITGHLERAARADGPAGRLGREHVDMAFEQLRKSHDPLHGGFGSAPKFPSPHNLVFLLRYGRLAGEPAAVEMVETTLEAMRAGGVWDHVGFGFHRYSTDRSWLLPHFEKMLYDQAMLVLACCEAHAASAAGEHRRTVEEIITYVQRDLALPGGAFASAEDADSDGEEGAFYVWTTAELEQVLGHDEARLAATAFNVAEQGNFEDEATGQRTGANILHLTRHVSAIAAELGMDADELAQRLEQARQKLLEARSQRNRPLRDDKVLADWNGLMAAAMARAGRLFGRGEWIEAAAQVVDFVDEHMRSGDGRLLHRHREGESSVLAFLDDHAFLAWALLELYDATFDVRYLERAVTLQDETIARFWDEANGGFYFSPADGEELLVRAKEVYDGAIPSGNSVALANLLRLAHLTGRTDLAQRAADLEAAFAAKVAPAPALHTHLMSAVLAAEHGPVEIVLTGPQENEAARALLEVIRSRYLPHAAVLRVPQGPDGDRLRRLAPFLEGFSPVDGKPAAYLCRDFVCRLPVTAPEQLAELIDER